MTNVTQTQPRRWADPKKVAEYTGIPTCTLATWRCNDPKRIPFHKIGRMVRYDLSEVDSVLAGSVV